MSRRRRQSALALAMATGRAKPPSAWGRNLAVGARVTTFGRHGAGQAAIDGEIVQLDGQTVTIRDERGEHKRTISNVRLAGTAR